MGGGGYPGGHTCLVFTGRDHAETCPVAILTTYRFPPGGLESQPASSVAKATTGFSPPYSTLLCLLGAQHLDLQLLWQVGRVWASGDSLVFLSTNFSHPGCDSRRLSNSSSPGRSVPPNLPHRLPGDLHQSPTAGSALEGHCRPRALSPLYPVTQCFPACWPSASRCTKVAHPQRKRGALRLARRLRAPGDLF